MCQRRPAEYAVRRIILDDRRRLPNDRQQVAERRFAMHHRDPARRMLQPRQIMEFGGGEGDRGMVRTHQVKDRPAPIRLQHCREGPGMGGGAADLRLPGHLRARENGGKPRVQPRHLGRVGPLGRAQGRALQGASGGGGGRMRPVQSRTG